ncbi:hypothetical protein [Alishewanella longhuensis]
MAARTGLGWFSLLLLVTLLTGQRFCQKNLTCGSQLAEQATLSRIALIERIEGIAELLVSQSVARQQQPLWQLSEQHSSTRKPTG